MRIFKCNTCGKIVVEVTSSPVTPICCGDPMTLLKPQSTDGALEKHVPVYEKKGSVICIKVGEQEHPMTQPHHIEFIVLETNKGFYLRYLFQDDTEGCIPGACFHLDTDEKAVSVVAYCNIHGLYINEIKC